MFNKKATTKTVVAIILMVVVLALVVGGLGAKNIGLINVVSSCDVQGGYCLEKTLLINGNCPGEESDIIRTATCGKEEVCCSGENPFGEDDDDSTATETPEYKDFDLFYLDISGSSMSDYKRSLIDLLLVPKLESIVNSNNHYFVFLDLTHFDSIIADDKQEYVSLLITLNKANEGFTPPLTVFKEIYKKLDETKIKPDLAKVTFHFLLSEARTDCTTYKYILNDIIKKIPNYEKINIIIYYYHPGRFRELINYCDLEIDNITYIHLKDLK